MTETVSHDAQGREWAKLSDLNAGDRVTVDNGFSCLASRVPHTLRENKHGLFIPCCEGQHYIAAHAYDGDHLVGIYKV